MSDPFDMQDIKYVISDAIKCALKEDRESQAALIRSIEPGNMSVAEFMGTLAALMEFPDRTFKVKVSSIKPTRGNRHKAHFDVEARTAEHARQLVAKSWGSDYLIEVIP